MPPADLATQRAYTLRLRPADAEDDGWWEPLWRTHEAVNRGAQVFGDFLLTLRGGLSHKLADEKVHSKAGEREPTEEERRDRRIVLATSWLSVESAPPPKVHRHIVASDQSNGLPKTVRALRRILAEQGVSEEDAAAWVSDCKATLEATIRKGAVWVNRHRCFVELCGDQDLEAARADCKTVLWYVFRSGYLSLPTRRKPEDEHEGPAEGLRRAEWAAAAAAAAYGAAHRTRHLFTHLLGGGSPFGAEKESLLLRAWWHELLEHALERECRIPLAPPQSSTGRRSGQHAPTELHREMLSQAASRVAQIHTKRKQQEVARRERLEAARKIDDSRADDALRERLELLDAYCARRAEETGSLEGYTIVRRQVTRWAQVVAAWDALAEANPKCTEQERAAEVRRLQAEYQEERRGFGDPRLFEDLAGREFEPVWRNHGEADPSLLLAYADWSQAQRDSTRLKVDAYRHPDPYFSPVFCRFGTSRPWIRFDRLSAQAEDHRRVSLLLWDGKAARRRTLRALSSRFDAEIGSREHSPDGDERDAVTVTRKTRAGLAAVERTAHRRTVRVAGVFDAQPVRSRKRASDQRVGRETIEPGQTREPVWNGMLMAPRPALRALGEVEAACPRKAERMRRRLKWYLVVSVELEPHGPWIRYIDGSQDKAPFQQRTASTDSGTAAAVDYTAWPHHAENEGRGKDAKLLLARLPGLRVLSVDLGHRYAAACAVWETVCSDQVEADCRKAGRKPPREDDLFLHLRVPHAANSRKRRTVIYRRIGSDVRPDGFPHPCPWARLDRQFLIKLQGEDEPARWPLSEEEDLVAKLLCDLNYSPWWRRGCEEGQSRRPPLRVDELMSEAVRACRLGLQRHGRVAVLAHRLVATHKYLPGGRTEELTEETRREELTSALMSWYELACGGGGWAPHATARKLWKQLCGVLPAGVTLPELSQSEDGDEDRQARRKRQDQLRAPLSCAAAALAGDLGLRSRFHRLWSEHWGEEDKVWCARLRWLRRWLLPRPSHLLALPRKTKLDRRSLTREQRNELLRRIRNVGGLSLTRLATIRSLYQVQKAYATRPDPEDPRRNVPEKGDTSLDRFGQRTLDALERLRENRVKQLASRIVEAALGIGLEQPDLKRKRGGRDPSRPRCRRFAPCHAVVIEDLQHYRPEQTRTRRENRQLMTWSAGKVRKYLEEGCYLAGLHLREVYAGYTSRQDSRTGAPGLRCSDVPAEWIVSESGRPWIRTRVKSALERAGKSDGTPADQYLAALHNYLAKLPEEERPAAVGIPDRSGDIFVSADPAAGRGIQADLNAAANIGISALSDPDWPGAWWRVPCDSSTYRPKLSECRESAAIDTKTPLRQRERRVKKDKDIVNLWRDVSCDPVTAEHGPWCEYRTYWTDVEQRVVRLLREWAGLGDP